jgi:mycofactocin glycosyltransferase
VAGVLDPMRQLTLDASVRRAGHGRVLIGGSPLTLMRLTTSGASLIDRIERGEPISGGANTRALIERLIDGGIVHPSYSEGPEPTDVTVVIPAYRPAINELRAIIGACANTAAVVVVDDASPEPIAAIEGATVIRSATNGGPGAARSIGLAHVSTPFVAFVDTDVLLEPGWLDPLLNHFTDPRVALVAPRVACAGSAATDRRLGRYELARSPLDLGSSAARVRAGTRVSYVPAAAVVCRLEALEAVGGFDPALRYGEDVDLDWRLDEAGWRVRYEPGAVVHHRPRAGLRRWIAQRFSYGMSAAPLAERHEGALAPVRVSGWSAASWAAVVGGWPIVGAAVAATTTAMLARKLRDVPDGPREALRLAGLGHLYAGRSLAAGTTRAWWPMAALAALMSKRARRAVLLAAIVPAVLDWRKTRPALDPFTYTALRILDDVSYGTGVAVGAVRTGSLAALRPDFRSWPTSGGRSPQRAGR